MFYRVRETVSNGLSVLCVCPLRHAAALELCAVRTESGKGSLAAQQRGRAASCRRAAASGGEWRPVAASGG